MGRTACPNPQCLYSRAIPLLPLWAVRPVHSPSACTVELYLFSRYGQYGLYRDSVHISRAIPLLPLWAVRSVQSLSACTVELYLYSPNAAARPVQSLSACTVELYLYSHYGPYGLYGASVPVQ